MSRVKRVATGIYDQATQAAEGVANTVTGFVQDKF